MCRIDEQDFPIDPRQSDAGGVARIIQGARHYMKQPSRSRTARCCARRTICRRLAEQGLIAIGGTDRLLAADSDGAGRLEAADVR